MKVKHITGDLQVADLFTKPLSSPRLSKLLTSINFAPVDTGESCNMVSINKSSIGILLLACSSDGFLLREKFLVQPNYRAIRIGNPCNLVIDSSLQGEINSFKEQQAKGKANINICRTHHAYGYESCIYKFNRIITTIDSFPGILVRPKRSVDAIFRNALIIADRIAGAATI